jgi:8-amino-7-oxononanoate synthase
MGDRSGEWRGTAARWDRDAVVDGSCTWASWADRELDEVRAAGRWRQNRSFDALGPTGRLDGRAVTSFASNDYLGLSAHPAVVAAAHAALERWGTGATASRLVVGTRPGHTELEEAVADWKGTDRALVFSSGYSANVGVLSTLGGPDVTVLSDALNHASIIDGCRLSRAHVAVFPHGDLDALDARLAAAPGRTMVVTDAVFSMDGDVADLAALGERCARHGALLVIDEAHSVLGPALPPVDGLEVLRVGTLSKSLGSLGGWVAGATPLIDLLVNRARSFIFTTALTPADTAAATAAHGIVRSAEGDALVARLRAVVDRVRPGHPSPIVPIVLGDEAAAVAAAAALLEAGLLVPAIRPPTVAVGTSRLRVALSAAHTDAMVDDLLAALDRLGLPR